MIVVFDTNAYRDLAANKTADETKTLTQTILEKEAQQGIKASMSTTVAMELMYHLQDNNMWKSYRSCIKSAPAMYLHCGDASSFRLLPLPEVQVAKTFYNVEATASIMTQQAVGQILFDLSQGDAGAVALKYSNELAKVHQFIEDAEQTLAQEMDNLLAYYDPNYKHDWNPFVKDEYNRRKYLNMVDSDEFLTTTAKAFIIAVGMMLKAKGVISKLPGYNDLDNAAELYVKNYGASLLFRRRFFKYLAGGGFDITKNSRANYMWDEQILHFAGHSVNGEKIMIVSTDGNMKAAANDFDSQIPFKTLNEYLAMLGL